MCIERLAPLSSLPSSGVGYKIVVKTNIPGVYENYYANFYRSKKGGALIGSNNKNPELHSYKKRIYYGCTYVLGVEYKVKHTRTTGYSKKKYRAGVHIWKTWETALNEWVVAGGLWAKVRAKLALVKVKYSHTVQHGSGVVVALRCTIIEEINMDSFTGGGN